MTYNKSSSKTHKKLKNKGKSYQYNKNNKYKTQKAGAAPSCLTNSSIDTSKYLNSCHTANLHNKNPEGAFNLLEGEGILPSNPVLKGGQNTSSCKQINEQLKPLTFTDYLNRTSSEISGGCYSDTAYLDNDIFEKINNPRTTKDSQNGGSGFSINPEEMIGGLPGRAKYDSCCQPVIINGKLTQGSSTLSVCGNQMAGSYLKKSNKQKRRKTKNDNKTHKHKTHKNKTHKNKKQKGGTSSYPFNGDNSDFDHLPDNKDFSAKQPYWNVNAR